MLRKLLVAAILAITAFGSVGVLADPGGGTPANEHGMCTAYFNGSEQGQSHKREAGPFQAFEDYVADNDGVDNDGDTQVDEGDEEASPSDVWNYCIDTEKGIGGTPDDPND